MSKDKTIDIKRFVGKDTFGLHNRVYFESFTQGIFCYMVADLYTGEDYTFIVPLSDIGTSRLKSSDRAIFFMRWIRKSIEDGTFIKFNT